jgi:hypothetical protein
MFDFGFSKEDDKFTARVIVIFKALMVASLIVGGLYLVACNPKSPVCAGVVVPPPEHLLIKGEIWDVVMVNQKDFSSPLIRGQTDCNQQVIFISNLEHGAGVRATLLHELFHTAVCKWNPKTKTSFPDNSLYNQAAKDADDHPAIYAAVDALAPILQDNPHLATYLASKDTPEQIQQQLGLRPKK